LNGDLLLSAGVVVVGALRQQGDVLGDVLDQLADRRLRPGADFMNQFRQ
jgi:hypothetical protein